MGTTPNVPGWLNLHALIDDELIAELAVVRAEADALAPAVRQLAIRAFRATEAFDLALARADLADEVWEIARDGCGAGATFDALRRLINDLQIARGEKPEGSPPDWFEREASEARQKPVTERVTRELDRG